MKAPLGVTLLFHVLIIGVSRIRSRFTKRRKRVRHLRRPNRTTDRVKVLASIVIQITIFISFLSVGIYSVAYAIEDQDSTVTMIQNHRYNLRSYEQTPIEPDTNHIIIRIDDVQAHTWADISMRMIDDAIKSDMKVSLGVIPHGLRTDRELVHFLKKHRAHIDYALHGWGGGNADYEFASLSKEEAEYRIKKGLEDLRPLTKRAPATFIPPNNVYSEGTHDALVEHGFTIVSSKGSGFFDYTAMTYDFETNSSIPNDVSIENCIEGFAKKNLCVVMLHPQDYANGSRIDEARYAQYLDLLERLKALNAQSVTFEDYVRTFEHHEGYLGAEPASMLPLMSESP